MLGRLFVQERALTAQNVWGHTSPSSPWGSWPGDPDYGIGVGPGSALQLTTVLGCVRLISDSISTLPVDVYRKSGDEKIPMSLPAWLEYPTPDLDFASWCGQVLSSLLLHGNAYVLIGRSQESRQIVTLRVLDPSDVTMVAGQYLVNNRAGGEVLHIRGLMLPGAECGLNPIAYARETIGLGLNAMRFGAEFFNGDGNMPGVIEMPKTAQEETKRQLASQWQRKRRSGGKGLPGVLDEGATWKPTGVTNEDAQFLATRNFTAAEIAGQIFLVDPSDLGIGVEGTSLTYANLEQRNARRVQVTLLPWITRVETAISALLAQPRYMKFNVSGLLRGDQLTQFQSWAIGIDNQILVPNEPRAWMDLAPLPGGDAVVPRKAPAGGPPNAA